MGRCRESDTFSCAQKYKIDEIVIAIPTLQPSDRREILRHCNETQCKLKVLPGVYQLINDEVSVSNINRQLIATHKTVGKAKVDVVKERILDINPDAKVEVFKEFVTKESRDYFDTNVSYVVDAIDTVTAKLDLIERANKLNVPIISCMGTGNKLDPTRFEITDINKTSVCPLAKVMRKELKQRGIKKLKVLYSKEEPIKQETNEGERRTPGSISFVPSVAGLIIAGEVIKDLIK